MQDSLSGANFKQGGCFLYAGELSTLTSYWCTFSTSFDEWRDELASLQLNLITHSSSNIS